MQSGVETARQMDSSARWVNVMVNTVEGCGAWMKRCRARAEEIFRVRSLSMTFLICVRKAGVSVAMGIRNRKAHLSLGKGREESLREGFLGCVLKAVLKQ